MTYILLPGTAVETAIEYTESVRPISSPGYHDFFRGLLLEVTTAQGRASLKPYKVQATSTPHGRNAYRLPKFALEVGKIVWVCPTCEDIFKGHIFNVEQYLAEQKWILKNLGVSFKLSGISSA